MRNHVRLCRAWEKISGEILQIFCKILPLVLLKKALKLI
ncbi:hypothetical protein CGSHiII_05244 [Haemophilus influenzae PittII]|nr:hypothetical protein BV121_1168 [Haemophilus influenzae]AVJ01612.1 hypothetical protein BV122_1174 [Haemophilus influenzae]EDK12385.1 hypothetical protein CGSHiII_05244 [Haemophilus influenzae PittII]